MKLRIAIDGKAYDVDVEVLEEDDSPEPHTHRSDRAGQSSYSHPASLGGTWDAAGNTCTSPVMGLAIKVNIGAGQAVEAGELLMVLEAMKMETNVTAPQAGTVKAVHVVPGDSVKVGQVLLELE